MAVGQTELTPLLPVKGLRLGTCSAGIKTPGRQDLVVMQFDDDVKCTGVFTRNAFCAAPVHIAKDHLSQASPRLLVINTGNANAGTGEQGMLDALAVCQSLADLQGLPVNTVLPFSTGVIGEPLEIQKIENALPQAVANLNVDGWKDAAHGILTTDTVAKGISKQVTVDGALITITGIAKGSGMIRPDMATMLAFIATDAALSDAMLKSCIQYATQCSFNRITVDGDTSTNDACMLIASGTSSLPLLETEDENYLEVRDAICEVFEFLAQAIIRDGEGATKLITVDVQEGKSEQECKEVAYTIAHSPLVKTAFFAKDPNWGRILAAVGRAGIDDLDLQALTIYLDDVCIVSNGGRAAGYEETLAQQVMDQDEITVKVNLGRGLHSAKVWTCDLSYDYVRINAEYRS